MSRSSYNERTTSATSDRDYDERKERERERSRNADRYDAETRHHGKWTAQGEVDDLDTSSSLPRAYGDARKSAHLGNRSYSDREHYDRDYYRGSRSASNYNSYDNYGGSYNTAGYDHSGAYGYGGIPNPPPMPPRDFWRHSTGGYRQSHPYYPQYGHASFDGSNYAGMGHHSGHHAFQSTGNFAQDIRQHAPELMHSLQGGYGGYGYDQGYGSRGMGSDYGFSGFGQTYLPTYGHQSYEYLSGGYPYDELYLSRGLGGLGLGSTRHLELGTTRPHVDIYELGNEYIIELDLPGHTRDHIETKLFGNELVITSRPPKRDFQYHINERSLGKHEVTRKFYLPSDVATSKIGATLTNGVLRVVLPRGSNTTATTTTIVDTTGTTTTTTQAATV